MRELKADLHMHSNWSDGSQTVSQLIMQGKTKGLKVMAVTDHDSTEGQSEAFFEGRRQQIAVISGIEISAYDPVTKRKVHILGYNYSNAEKIKDRLRPYLDANNNIMLNAIKRIQNAGYAIELEDVQAYASKGNTIYRQHIMQALSDRGFCLSIYGELYDRIFGTNGFANIDSRCIPVLEAVKLIKSCNGSAVLAHGYKYNSLGMLPILKSEGLDGLEAYHPSHSFEKIQNLIECAKRYGLFTTGGSDTHGSYSEQENYNGYDEYFIEEDHPLMKEII